MRQKLFEIFFPNKKRAMDEMMMEVAKANLQNHELRMILKKHQEEIVSLQKQLQEPVPERNENPTLADLMRENLGLLQLDFKSVDANGNMASFWSDELPEEVRKNRLARLSEVYHNEIFQEFCTYLINKQGNFTMRQAVNDSQIYAGRFSINGVSSVVKGITEASELHDELNKPPEEFDPHEVI